MKSHVAWTRLSIVLFFVFYLFSCTSEDAQAGYPYKLRFITAAQTVTVGNCSGIATIQSKDYYSNPASVRYGKTVNLSGTYFTFYSDASCSIQVTATFIPAGKTNASFYFKNSTAGSRAITASASGLYSGSQTETMISAPTPSPSPAPAPSPSSTPPPSSGLRPLIYPLYGVTTDSVSNLSAIVESLQRLAYKPTTRVVFDEWVAATYYKTPVTQINSVSYVMGEILDSFYVSQYSVDQYNARTTEYLDTLGNLVDIWEVGNEVNGEWLGTVSSTVAKITGAYNLVKARGARTELTLYYNQDCWMYPWEEMFGWARANIPDYMKQGLDLVLVSYYEDDCNGLQPDWPTVFQKLAVMFPNSKIGFGETGTTNSAKKAEYINRYYNMQINLPNYIGGYFWWYFNQDMVPYTKTLWSTLNQAIM